MFPFGSSYELSDLVRSEVRKELAELRMGVITPRRRRRTGLTPDDEGRLDMPREYLHPRGARWAGHRQQGPEIGPCRTRDYDRVQGKEGTDSISLNNDAYTLQPIWGETDTPKLYYDKKDRDEEGWIKTLKLSCLKRKFLKV